MHQSSFEVEQLLPSQDVSNVSNFGKIVRQKIYWIKDNMHEMFDCNDLAALYGASQNKRINSIFTLRKIFILQLPFRH